MTSVAYLNAVANWAKSPPPPFAKGGDNRDLHRRPGPALRNNYCGGILMALKVMIVDDSLFMRKMLCDLLEKEGYQVVAEASDGVEAVAKYQEARPELTTLDIVMPNKTGIEALQEIMAFDPAARVVMCSAVGQESFTAAAAQAGARAFILKPFNPELVVRVLKEACEG